MQIDEQLLYRQVGARLKEQRNLAGLTQAALAELSGVSRASIAIIEQGKQSSPLHIIYRLCAALGVEVTSVLPRNAEVAERRPIPMFVTENMLFELPKTTEFLQESQKILGKKRMEGDL